METKKMVETNNPSKADFVDHKYKNPWKPWPHGNYFSGAIKLIKWMSLMGYRQWSEKNLEGLNCVEPYFVDKSNINKLKTNCIRATWLGHASVLVEIEGIRILCDPMFSKRCFPHIGFSRYFDAPCKVSDLPDIDAVVISHNHYDHMDTETLKDLIDWKCQKSDKITGTERKDSLPLQPLSKRIKWCIPMGVKENLKYCVGDKFKYIEKDVYEMNWWDKQEISGSNDAKLTIVFTPTQHWSNRGTLDAFKTLWGSWAFIGKEYRFWFGGDTGYCPAFKQIGNEYGPFDGAAIPIGAYKPRSLLEFQHVNPEDAVKIHQDIKSRVSFGIHWGTFVLSEEKCLDPKFDLEKAVKEVNENVSKEPILHENKDNKICFFTMNHGETVEIEKDSYQIFSKESVKNVAVKLKNDNSNVINENLEMTNYNPVVTNSNCFVAMNHGETVEIEKDSHQIFSKESMQNEDVKLKNDNSNEINENLEIPNNNAADID